MRSVSSPAGGPIRNGSARGRPGLPVEGTFDVARLPGAEAVAARIGAPLEDRSLRIRRELLANGRGKITIQGRSARVSDLRLVGEQLLAIHGQGEHRRLLDPAVQLDLIDRYAQALTGANFTSPRARDGPMRPGSWRPARFASRN